MSSNGVYAYKAWTGLSSRPCRDEWQPGMALVDFTNPAAYKWYADLIKNLLKTGVDTIKTDFGERIPHLGVAYHDGSDP